MSEVMRCARVNYMRPVDWRWLRAMGALDHTQPQPTRRLDHPEGYKWIRNAMRFKRQLDQCDDDTAHCLLAEREPALYWAYYIQTSVTNPSRYAIEAMILARQSDWEIGFFHGLPPEVIEAYEAVFFNVREKLEHTGYITNCVMGPAIHRGLSEREYELLWKMFGYSLGPNFLKGMITKFPQAVWCSTPDGVNTAVQDDAIATLKMKACLAAKTIPINQHTQIALMELFTKFTEIERNTDTAAREQGQLLDHVTAMLTALPFNVGGRDPRNNQAQVDTGPIAEYDASAVELTYEETMRVSVGQRIPNEGTLKSLRFPQTVSTQTDPARLLGGPSDGKEDH